MNWLLTTIPSVPTEEIPFVTRATPATFLESVTVKPVGRPSLLRPKNESAAIFAFSAAICAFLVAAATAALVAATVEGDSLTAAGALATAAAKKAQQAAINAKIAALSFFGLDNNGIPTGFSVTDEDGSFGKARVTKGISTVGTSGILINNQFITGSVGPNLIIDQLITVDGTGTRYSTNGINIGWVGNWNSVEIKSTDSSIDRLANGQYLITATFNLGYLNESDFVIPTGSRGYDLADAPASITTRILMNAGKTQVLAQAVQVNN